MEQPSGVSVTSTMIRSMLTYEDALQRILSEVPPPRIAAVTLDQALGLVLAKPVIAACDLPRFDHSAVDGYALCVPQSSEAVEGMASPVTLRLIGQAEAGRPFIGHVQPGEAVRIFTGAQIPQGANAVVMQEHITRNHDTIVMPAWPKPGQHIRRQGEDLCCGTQALPAGACLRPQELALLASLGVRRVPVYRPPTAVLLSTGDELRAPSSRLKAGQIYDSNTVLLHGLVRRLGAHAVPVGCLRDHEEVVSRVIRRHLNADLLLMSGGVSVGEKDVVRQAAARCGVRTILWKVDMKPGMPLFVGRYRRTLVFGLPGNPVAAFVTFEEFVKPVINRLMGRAWHEAYATPATLAKDLVLSQTRRTHFIRVRRVMQDGGLAVEPVNGQGSHQLASLSQADGWIRVESDHGPWRAGTPVLLKTDGRS